MDYLLKNRPSIFCNIECSIEMYDDQKLMDAILINFMRKRKYLNGFLPYLYKLEKENKIIIDIVHKVPFGSSYYEGCSYIIWRPI